ncbi:MAG: hypothetical protein HY590_01570 [Candidatus Omnitrophica bacterium]|nr:hypothetical protein [Candidatus Omnitrophota bacterium]
MNRKAISLLSGGLDSTLATKIVLEQGIEVIGLHFAMPWGCCDRTAAYSAAKLFGIHIMVFKMQEDYLDVIHHPKYGYGRAMNPCVDCRIHMYWKAKAYMEEIGASFLITGEVLGQRPKSQMLESLKTIERDCDLRGRILRPLSAHALDPTIPEKEGVVDRSQLLGISGRSRRIQMALAEEKGIRNYPTPAGGCLLTDEAFSRRVKDLLEHSVHPTIEEMELLRIGRHFRLNPVTKLIVGRNESENDILEYYGTQRPLFRPVDFPGPSTLIVGEESLESERAVASLTLRYGEPEEREKQELLFSYREGERRLPVLHLFTNEELERMRL